MMHQLPIYTLLPYPPDAHAQTLARDWLAQQLQYPAGQLPLYRDARGRPRLAAPLADIDISWSHSGEKLLVACGKNIQLGCDLEYIRPRPNALKLARRFFHPQEADWLENLSPSEREMAFLHLWCAKEAILKAHGHGLSFGLEKLCLNPTPVGLVMSECHPQLGNPQDWQLQISTLKSLHIVAIAWKIK
ncbi:4-phosphopantetheinyl transferase [Lysobacteraceae bacterium NML03-0222]|nr:4-phosphopantetheinyl transferase [Xanthomonadaceae bacterium NML03-0222]PJK07208.1 4-phosphopantetheinyl transferase [Xanthomonadaceae bacterium NML71-0210]